jgi:hypothetical protein
MWVATADLPTAVSHPFYALIVNHLAIWRPRSDDLLPQFTLGHRYELSAIAA